MLSVCATSCASERLFSVSGNIVTPTRTCLNPDKVNMLVFFGLKTWSKSTNSKLDNMQRYGLYICDATCIDLF